MSGEGVWRLRWRRLRRDRPAMAGGAVLLLLALAAISASLWEAALGVSGVETDLLGRFEPPGGPHLLGQDEAGRDVLARLLRGGQVSLAIGALGALGCTLLGTLVGCVAGYRRGMTEAVLMRVTDFVMSLPGLPLLIILAALDLTKLGFGAEFARSPAAGFWRIVVIVVALGWTGIARLSRAATLAAMQREYVLSAQAQGASAWRILGVHVLPDALAPVIVAATLAMGRIILTEAALSFLGVGIQPPMTSWGSMLNNAQDLLVTAPLLAVWPGALILATVIAVNFLGDGLQAALDPKSDPR